MNADVVELVDTQDLGSCDESRGGSSPLIRTSLLNGIFNNMQFAVTKSDNLSKEYKVILEASQLQSGIDQMVKQRARTFKMHGFRVGNVPLDVVRKYTEHEILGKVIGNLAQEACNEIAKDDSNKDRQLATMPLYDVIGQYEDGRDLEIKITFSFSPEFELADVNIDMEKIVPIIEDAGVDTRIAEIKKNSPVYEVVHDAVKPGDLVTYKASCFEKGIKVESRGIKDTIRLPYDIPADADLLNGFIGKKPKERFDFNPATEKDTNYIVIVQSIQRPSAISDDDYAKKIGVTDGKQFREAVKHSIQEDMQQKIAMYHKNQILEAFDDKYSFDLPADVLEIEFKNIINNVRNDIKNDVIRGKVSADELNKTDEELREEYKDVVYKRVKLGYILNKIAIKNNVTATDKEVQSEILSEILKYPQHLQQQAIQQLTTKAAFNYRKATIMERKVIDFVMQNAKCTEKHMNLTEINALIDRLFDEEEK